MIATVFLVKDARPADVFLEREQEVGVLRDLRERSLDVVVDLGIVGELDQEGGGAAGTLQLGHPQEERARLLVLGDRLERFDVLKPEVAHAHR